MFGTIGAIIGIIMLVAGVFLAFFFPGTTAHQPEGFAVLGIIMGIALLAGGILLVFF